MIAAPTTKYRAVFRRLETDVELRMRLLEALPRHMRHVVFVAGEDLDKAAWDYARLQRRIVEDVS